MSPFEPLLPSCTGHLHLRRSRRGISGHHREDATPHSPAVLGAGQELLPHVAAWGATNEGHLAPKMPRILLIIMFVILSAKWP